MTQIYTRPVISPLHERPSPYHQKPDPFIQRKFQGADKYPLQYPDRRYEGNRGRVPQPRSPMSDLKKRPFEVPAPKVGDMYQTRPETTQKPPREQLPPLSSLFGSTPHQSRPVQSPYSDRHSPVFLAVSPNDARHPATPIHPDRPYDGSYFQRPPPSRQYSYDSKLEKVERHGIPPPPRPTQSGIRPESPRFESRYAPIDAPSSQASSSVSGWSPRSQSSRQEFFPRDTSSSFRGHSDHRPQSSSVHRAEPEARQSYHGPPQSIPNYPPTPASTVSGDSVTTKDGLGPKIWTGIQFLPRFVRQAEVPGEGMCYFYDDGTHCKTVIDGEVVNAHWGVTKAGKPRKRLAIACITCREKKIKCDPDYPRCVQCEKFGRVCKFKNAPRGGQGSPDTPPADPEDIVPGPVSSRLDTESVTGEKREISHSVSPRQVLHPGTPDSEAHHWKRQRTGYNDFTPVASEASPRPSVQEAPSPATAWAEPLISGPPLDHNLVREWQTNPYISHPALVTELLTTFFRNVPETVYCMFPERAFKAWVLSSGEKTPDNLMVIYTILALGTVFSLKPEHRALGAQYGAISRYACDNRHFSLQLVQSRLLLALYYFAINSPNDAWDFCGSALRAASGLKLNLEIEKTDDAFLQIFPYGLNRHGYAECRRRTFWSCYIMDRFDGFCSGHISVIQPEDVFLRLPCDVKLFESQAETQTPFFDLATQPPHNANGNIDSLAYLINISTIWGDVTANIYRTSQRPVTPNSNSAFTTFYEATTYRLKSWVDSLPSNYTFSTENLRRATETGKLGTFMTMHTVYHGTVMKLNRYIQKSTLSSTKLAHHVSIARQHAEALLAVMEALTARGTSTPSTPTEHAVMPRHFSSPFVGYAIVSAIDILTSEFPLSSVPALLTSFGGAQSILAELALFWQSGKNQQALIAQRSRDLSELRDGQGGAGAIGFKFGNMGVVDSQRGDGNFKMQESLETTFSRGYDCVYD